VTDLLDPPVNDAVRPPPVADTPTEAPPDEPKGVKWFWTTCVLPTDRDDDTTQDPEVDRNSQLYLWVTEAVYIVIALALLGLTLFVLWRVVHEVLDGVPIPTLTSAGKPIFNKKGLQQFTYYRSFEYEFPEVLGGLILAVIILELLETVYEQIVQSHDRLTFRLVRNFFIIGAVSAIRHILVIGAELSLSTSGVIGSAGANPAQELSEFRTNMMFVGVLVVSIVIIVFAEDRFYLFRDRVDLKRKAQQKPPDAMR
jgi:hypothetical protein